LVATSLQQHMVAAPSNNMWALGIVTEEAEVEVTKKVGSKDWVMGALHLAIYTREAAHVTATILAQERISLPVAINKTAEWTTPWSAKDLPKRYVTPLYLLTSFK
jgi:hypothetical protein